MSNSGFAGRGGGRGGRPGWGSTPPSFSRFRARNMGTGANDTPLGTPARSFPSSPSPSGNSPITTPVNGTPAPVDAPQDAKSKEQKRKSKLQDSSGPHDATATSLKPIADKKEDVRERKEKKLKSKALVESDLSAATVSDEFIF